MRPVEAERDFADCSDDEHDAHEQEDEADDGERHHLEHAVVLVGRPVAGQQRGLKERQSRLEFSHVTSVIASNRIIFSRFFQKRPERRLNAD